MQKKQIIFFTATQMNAAFRQEIDQAVSFQVKSVQQIRFPISVVPLSNWILASGFWNDNGVWDDNSFWID